MLTLKRRLFWETTLLAASLTVRRQVLSPKPAVGKRTCTELDAPGATTTSRVRSRKMPMHSVLAERLNVWVILLGLKIESVASLPLGKMSTCVIWMFVDGTNCAKAAVSPIPTVLVSGTSAANL